MKSIPIIGEMCSLGYGTYVAATSSLTAEHYFSLVVTACTLVLGISTWLFEWTRQSDSSDISFNPYRLFPSGIAD